MNSAVFRGAWRLSALVVVLAWLVATPHARQGSISAGEPAIRDLARAAALLRTVREGLDHVPGEVLVKFRAGTDAQAQAAVLALAPAPDHGRRVRWIGELALVDVDAGAPIRSVVERLGREPEVEYAQPNYFTRLSATPNDPGLVRQWNFTAIDMPRAWDINPGAQDVLVAVVDTGVTNLTATLGYQLWTGNEFELVPVPYAINPDIDASRIAAGRDTTSTRLIYSGLATQPVLDTEGHGTHVAGTILQSTDNAIGYAGIAYRARLLPVKSCFSYWDFQFYLSALGQPGFVPPTFAGGCINSDVIDGIRFAADAGAKVINLSLGGPGESPAELEALNYAVSQGAFVSIAMGNEFEEGNAVSYPAGFAPQLEGAMSVAAVGPSLRRAFYSNTGAHTEIAAPGGDFRDGGLSGVIYQVGIFDPDFDPNSIIEPRFDRYYDKPSQGTSMAAPHVAGLAALLYSQGITRPAAIEAAIKRFARDLGEAGSDGEYGQGLIDARATLRGLGLAR